MTAGDDTGGGETGGPSERDAGGDDRPPADPRRHVITVARMELRRTVRGAVGDPRGRLVALAAGAVIAVGLSVTLGEAHRIGTAVRGGTVLGLVDAVRGNLGLVALLFVALFAMRSAAALVRPDNLPLLATTLSARAVVGGVLLAEYLRNAAVFGALVLLHAAAFGAGVGAPVVAVPATVATLLLLAAALLVGYLLAVGVSLATSRSSLDPRAALMAAVAAAVIGLGIAGDGVGTAAVAAYADLALTGSPLVPVPRVGSLLVAGAVLAALPLLAALAVRSAPVVWREAEGGAGGGAPAVLTATPPYATADQPAGLVAWIQWVRAVRSPVRVVHVAYLALLLVPPAMVIAVLPSLGGTLGAALLGLAGAWFAGAAFALNPVDDEGDALPVVLLSQRRPAAFVRGRALAGAVPGTAVVAVAGAAALVLADARTAAAVWAVGAVAAVAGAGGAAGLGFFAVRHADLGSGPRPEVPNPFVVVVYTVAAFGCSAVALLALLAPALLGDLTPLPGVPAVAVAVLLAMLAAGAAGYRYAVAALARHTLG